MGQFGRSCFCPIAIGEAPRSNQDIKESDHPLASSDNFVNRLLSVTPGFASKLVPVEAMESLD